MGGRREGFSADRQCPTNAVVRVGELNCIDKFPVDFRPKMSKAIVFKLAHRIVDNCRHFKQSLHLSATIVRLKNDCQHSHAVSCPNKQPSFEPLMCWDLILER